MKTIIKKQLLSFMVLLLSCMSVSAQFGEIRGIVTDKKSGDPLSGATVSYYQSGTLKGTITDDKGEYKIKPLVAGTYELNFSFVTFKPRKVEGILVSAEKTTYVNMAMEPDNELPEVVIKWEAPLVDPGIYQTMKVITPEEIEQNVSRNVIDMVSTTAGIYQKDEGGSLNVRGSRSDATLYVVDGIKMTGPFSLPNSAIAEITVITGGIPAQFGDVTGGVVLITTKSYRRH